MEKLIDFIMNEEFWFKILILVLIISALDITKLISPIDETVKQGTQLAVLTAYVIAKHYTDKYKR